MNAGIILAAGRGSRMKELTAQKPKCLLRLAGKPLLSWQVNSLREAGVDRLLVVRGYASECIVGDFETVENPRWQSTNMLATLLCARQFAMSAFADGVERLIISYSDIVYNPDHVRALLACPKDIAITYDTAWEALWRTRFGDPLLDAETFLEQNGVLCEIGGKAASLDDIHGQYMGLLSFNLAGWQNMARLCSESGEKIDKMDMTAFLRAMLNRGIPIGAVPVAGRWCEADTEKDIEAYERALAIGNWRHDWR